MPNCSTRQASVPLEADHFLVCLRHRDRQNRSRDDSIDLASVGSTAHLSAKASSTLLQKVGGDGKVRVIVLFPVEISSSL